MFRVLLVVLGILAASTPGRSQEPASLFEGTWVGDVTAPDGKTMLGFRFTRTGNGLSVTFSMPAMHVYDATVGPATFDGAALVLPPLDTRLRREGDALVGTFAIPALPVVLRRADAMPVREPAPKDRAGPKPFWEVPLGAEMWASPVVRDGIVYVGNSAGRMFARNASDGSAVWTWPGRIPLYGTALVTSEQVFFVDAAWDVVCLDRSSGLLRWRRNVFRPADPSRTLKDNETFNRRTPQPVWFDGLVIVGSADGGVYALDPATGVTRWRHEAGTGIFAAPGVADGLLIFAGLDGSVFALDPVARTERARTRLPRAVVSTPRVANRHLIVGCRDYMLYGLEWPTLAPGWRKSFWFSWVESTPAIEEDAVFVGGSDYARITALEPRRGRVEWETPVRGLTWGTPLVTRDAVYAGTHAQRGALIPHEGAIVALDRFTGAVRWRVSFPMDETSARAGVVGSLALAGDRLIAARFDGVLAAYPLRLPPLRD